MRQGDIETVKLPPIVRWFLAGAVLMVAGVRGRITPEVALVGAGSSAVLAAVDVAYVAKQRISPVYLADAAAELSLLTGWAAASRFVRT